MKKLKKTKRLTEKSLLNCVLQMLSCPMCLLSHVLWYLICLVSYLLSCPTCLVPYILSCLMCLVPYMPSFSRCLTCSHALRASHPPCSRASRALCPTCSCAFLAIFLYVLLLSHILGTPCTNIPSRALEFPCLTLLFFRSFPTCDFLEGDLLKLEQI